jgi:DNA-binding NarL/FixJ family response regulator
VGTAVELLDAVPRLQPDAVVTDIRMPPGHHMEGIDAALEIRRSHPGVGVVVLSQHIEESYAFALFEEGTDGLAYLLKERVGDLDEVLRALQEVSAGRSCRRPSGGRGAGRSARPPARVGAVDPHAARAGGAPADGRRPDERGDRRHPAPVGVGRGEARGAGAVQAAGVTGRR